MDVVERREREPVSEERSDSDRIHISTMYLPFSVMTTYVSVARLFVV